MSFPNTQEPSGEPGVAFNAPPLPSAPDQEARAIGNVLLAMADNPDEARAWTTSLRAELFTEHSAAFEALIRITADGRAFTFPAFVAELAAVSGMDKAAACGRAATYTDSDRAAGIAADFNEALGLLEEAHARRELMRDGLANIARAQSIEVVALKPTVSAWPDLDPGLFPLDALPAVAATAAQALADAHSLPLELAGMTALATLAAACGKGWQLSGAVIGKSNFANVFVLAGAERGVGKGSVGALVEPLTRISAEQEQHWRDNVLPELRTKANVLKRRAEAAERDASGATDHDRGAAIAKATALQQELEAALHQIETMPSLWASDITSQKLGVLLAGSLDESLLIYSPEGGAVIRVWLGRYENSGKADIDLLLSGYSCEASRVDRIGRASISLRAPSLTTLLMVQPLLVRELFGSQEARERGLLARTLAFVAPGNVVEEDGSAREPDPKAMDEWSATVGCLLRLRHDCKEPLAVRAEAGAETVFREFYNEGVRLRLGALAEVSSDLSRWRENACRVALAIHVAENPKSVVLTAETAERAVRLVRWAGLCTVRLLASGLEAKAKARADKLGNWLLRADGMLTLGTLSKKHGMDEPEVESLSRTFREMFVMEDLHNPKGGPRTKTIRLAH